MSGFKDRHQTIHVNYRGSYLEVEVSHELDDKFNVTVACEVRIPRYCEMCNNRAHGGLVFRVRAAATLTGALQDLMDKLLVAVKQKCIYFEDRNPKGFRVPNPPKVWCADCTHWPKDKGGRLEQEWHPAKCPGGAKMNIFDGQPYLRMEYDASDCEHFQNRKAKTPRTRRDDIGLSTSETGDYCSLTVCIHPQSWFNDHDCDGCENFRPQEEKTDDPDHA